MQIDVILWSIGLENCACRNNRAHCGAKNRSLLCGV